MVMQGCSARTLFYDVSESKKARSAAFGLERSALESLWPYLGTTSQSSLLENSKSMFGAQPRTAGLIAEKAPS